MSDGYLFDASFVISFFREVETHRAGEASRFLRQLKPGSRTYLSVVAYAEILEQAEDMAELSSELRSRFQFQSVGQDVAERVAVMQSRSARRMGENEAWIAATAVKSGLTLVGDDDEAFAERPGLPYLNFRRV